MSDYYDRDGREITMEEWGALHRDPQYKIIIKSKASECCEVSTVWLGLDHGFPRFGQKRSTYRPIIFETMVFCSGEEHEWTEYQERYETYDAAVLGHNAVFAAIKEGVPIPWYKRFHTR